MNSRTGNESHHYKRRCDCVLGAEEKNEILPFWGPYYCGKPGDSFWRPTCIGTPNRVYYPTASMAAGAVEPQYMCPNPEPEGYVSNTLFGHIPVGARL
jgi:hypothetical protein